MIVRKLFDSAARAGFFDIHVAQKVQDLEHRQMISEPAGAILPPSRPTSTPSFQSSEVARNSNRTLTINATETRIQARWYAEVFFPSNGDYFLANATRFRGCLSASVHSRRHDPSRCLADRDTAHCGRVNMPQGPQKMTVHTCSLPGPHYSGHCPG